MGNSDTSPNDGTNWISNLFLCWAIPVFCKGSKRALDEDDMHPLQKGNKSKDMTVQLSKAWNKNLGTSNPSLLKALTTTYWGRFWTLGLAYFFKEGILQVLVSLAVSCFVGAYTSSVHTQPPIVAYSALAIIILSVIYAFTTNHLYLASAKLGNNISTTVSVLVFRKILGMSPSAIQPSNAFSTLHLITEIDTKRFEFPIGMLHAIWVGPTIFVLVGAILWLMYGPEIVAGLIVMLILSLLAGILGRLFSKARHKTSKCAEERLKLIENIIADIRVIKTNVWENLFLDSVQEVRRRELESINGKQSISAFSSNIQTLFSRLTILSTLLTYVILKDPVTAEKVFVVMSFYNIVSRILSGPFPAAFLILAELRISIQRLQGFLLLPERSSDGVRQLPGKPSPFKTYGKVAVTEFSGSWGKNQVPAIQNLTLRVGAGHPIFVIGPAGSGKSSLLHGIMGELETVHGKIEVEGRLAVAGQIHWAYEDTIQENIIFGKALSRPWYQQILDATGLVQEIHNFAGGYSTHISTLSSDLKARISLARALYTDDDIYLLDDFLNGVDAKQAQEIWHKVIKGLLREKCLMVVTTQVHLIAPNDHVLLLDGGKVKDFGTRAYIEDRHPNEFKQPLPDQFQNANDETDEQTFSLKSQTELQSPKIKDASELSPLISRPSSSLRENRRTGRMGLRLCWHYLKIGNNVPKVMAPLILLLIAQAIMSFSDIWLTWWTNSTDAQQKDQDDWFYPGIYIGVVVLDFILGWIANYFYFVLGISSGRKLHDDALGSVVQTKMSFFDTKTPDQILNNFSNDVSNVDEYLGRKLFGVINCGLQVLGVLVVACILHPILIVPGLILLVLVYAMRSLYFSAALDSKRLEAAARGPAYSHLNVSLEGVGTIRAFEQQAFMLDKFYDLKDAHSRAYLMFIFSCTWFTLVLNLLIILFQCVVLALFIWVVSDKSGSALIIVSVFTLTEIFNTAVQKTADLEHDLVSVERLLEYGKLPPEGGSTSTRKWVEGKGAIDMENLEVRYDDRDAVLRGVNAAIKGAEKIAVIGPGKSFIAAALLRFVEASGGRLLINGHNIQYLILRELRSNISVISKTPGFLNASLRKNLDPFDAHSDGEIWSILGSLQLKETILGHPDTIFQMMEPTGSNFSQTERFLISCGRALLSKKRIVILDETGTNIDSITEKLMQSIIRDKFENVTVIALIQKLDTIRNYDRVLVLEDGKVVNFDTPDVVISQKQYLEL